MIGQLRLSVSYFSTDRDIRLHALQNKDYRMLKLVANIPVMYRNLATRTRYRDNDEILNT
jgi:hypothetical protein